MAAEDLLRSVRANLLRQAQVVDRARGWRFCRDCGCTDAHPCPGGCRKLVRGSLHEDPLVIICSSCEGP